MSSYTKQKTFPCPYYQLPIAIAGLFYFVSPVEMAYESFIIRTTLHTSLSPSMTHLSASNVTSSTRSIRRFANSQRNRAPTLPRSRGSRSRSTRHHDHQGMAHVPTGFRDVL